MPGPFFRFEHVGSFRRPAEVTAARLQLEKGEKTQEQFEEVAYQHIAQIIDKQVEAGLKVVTDGEFTRETFHLDFMSGLTGVKYVVLPEGYKFAAADSCECGGEPKFVITKGYNVEIVDKVKFNPDHLHLKQWTKLKALADARGVLAKQTIPSPNMFMHINIRTNPVYSDIKEYANDVALAYKQYVKAFYDLGCRYLQFDDCFFTYLVDDNTKEREAAVGADVNDLIEICAQTLRTVCEDKPDDLTLAAHFCRGNYKSTYLFKGAYDAVAPAISTIPLDVLLMEWEDERSGDFQPLKHFANQKVILGIFSSKTPQLEDRAFINQRIQDATQYIPLDRLGLSHQCGFSSTEDGNFVTEEQQWPKLALVKEIVDEVFGPQ